MCVQYPELLSGAEFELYEKGIGNNADRKIYLIDLGNGVYRVSHTGNDNNGAVIQAGKVTIEGLDAGDYYLKETKNPDGYTKLLVIAPPRLPDLSIKRTFKPSLAALTAAATPVRPPPATIRLYFSMLYFLL